MWLEVPGVSRVITGMLLCVQLSNLSADHEALLHCRGLQPAYDCA